MKRRSFLRNSSLVAVSPLIAGIPVSALAKTNLDALVNPDDDKVLVLIQLAGGNDGLNMLVPRNKQDALAVVRNNIFIPTEKLINLTDTLAFHPSMMDMYSVHDSGKLNIVQGVSYPDQNRSHFRSSDIWHTASSSDEFLTTGWMGRYFESKFPNYPSDYPNKQNPDPFALTIGTNTSETCQGHEGNFSMAVSNPDRIDELNSPVANEMASGCYATQLDFLSTAIQQTNEYGEVIKLASEKGSNLSQKYVEDNKLSDKLKLVARMISGGLKTKVYVVSLGGFDTHSDQVDFEDTTVGKHAELLQSLSEAVCAFQDDLKLLGLEERVVGMTYSEFGRRIRSNGSGGTDHGTAAPMMIFGSCVNPIVIGENPDVDVAVDNQEGVPMQYDFRSIYGTILMDWFGVERTAVEELLFFNFQHLPIIRNCNPVTSSEEVNSDVYALKLSPNPFSSYLHIDFTSTNEWLKVSLFNNIGGEIKVLSNQNFAQGEHRITMEAHDIPSGVYFVRIEGRDRQKTMRVVKI